MEADENGITNIELAEWCAENNYMLLVMYRDKLRRLTPVTTFTTQTGYRRLSAFDSTHDDEENPRTYKLEEMAIIGIVRFRPRRVELAKAQPSAETGHQQAAREGVCGRDGEVATPARKGAGKDEE